ncbi:hypothetical protein [Halopelagius inordinatus]|uniref:hypothetical protein n=1 Tax=Halopelagius inordinatus TaxID=553467 RepID=UPI000AFA349C|nr:hypothetical protein [Halopelagius inordinatus]
MTRLSEAARFGVPGAARLGETDPETAVLLTSSRSVADARRRHQTTSGGPRDAVSRRRRTQSDGPQGDALRRRRPAL